MRLFTDTHNPVLASLVGTATARLTGNGLKTQSNIGHGVATPTAHTGLDVLSPWMAAAVATAIVGERK